MADTKTIEPKAPALVRAWDWITETQIWTSIFRHAAPINDRNRVLVMLSNVFLHMHPVRLRKSGVRLRYTWCMGGISFFLFLVLTFTGLLLMFYYRPTLEYAYSDIVGLREHVPLGIMREMHRWGAHAMVITVWLHMFRVFMTGSYKPPREFNWNIGVIMLVLTLLLSFTGYLLPWDQLAIWAITVGSNMARATPFLGHEGPGASLMALGDVQLVHAADDARFALLGGTFVGEGGAAAVLRAALRRPAARHRLPDGDSLLARPQGRRHLRPALERAGSGLRLWTAETRHVGRVEGLHRSVCRSAVVLRHHGGGAGADRVEARGVLLHPLGLGADDLPHGVLRLRPHRLRLQPDHHQAGQRAHRRADLPARVLHVVLDAAGGRQRPPRRRRPAADREGRGGPRLDVARPRLHRADLDGGVHGGPDRVVDRARGAHRAAGEQRQHPPTRRRRPGTSSACRRCSSTSTRGWPGWSCRR